MSYSKLLLVVLLVAALVAPAHAWRGIGWNTTYQLPQLDAGGLIFKDGDVLKSTTGNTAVTLSADGTVTIPTMSVSSLSAARTTVVTSAAAPTAASTAIGDLWMTPASPDTADATYVSDGAGGTEQPQGNELYVFDGTIWVPLFTGITP